MNLPATYVEVFKNYTFEIDESSKVYKKYLLDVTSGKDEYAYEQNVKIMKTSYHILIVTVFICLTLLYIFFCNIQISNHIYELILTYTIVILIQIVFIKTVILKYKPVKYIDIMNNLNMSIDQLCSNK